VRASNESLVTRAREYNYADRSIVAQFFEQRGAFFPSFDVQSIPFIGTIDRDNSDALAFFEQQCLVSLWHLTPVMYELNLLGGRSFRVVSGGLLVGDPRYKQPEPVLGGFRYLHSNSRGAIYRRRNSNH